MLVELSSGGLEQHMPFIYIQHSILFCAHSTPILLGPSDSELYIFLNKVYHKLWIHCGLM